MPKSYPPEFRRRALDLVAAGRSIAEVALDLDISQAALYGWREQQLIDAGELAGMSSEQASELVTARRRIRELEAENLILRRASEALREAVPPKARFGLIADLVMSYGAAVQQAFRVLGVSDAGYYKWRKRPPSARAIRHAWLTDQITQIHVRDRLTGACSSLPTRCEGAVALRDLAGSEDGLVTSSSSVSAFAGFRSPREVISVAVRWYLR